MGSSTARACVAMKKARTRRAFRCCSRAACAARDLDRADARGRRALGAVGHFEFDLLALLQRLEAVHLDLGMMGEEVLAAVIRGDEAVAFGVVEPLHGTGCHV